MFIIKFVIGMIPYILVGSSMKPTAEMEYACQDADNDRLLVANEPFGLKIDPSWNAPSPYEKFLKLALMPPNELRYLGKEKLYEIVKIAYEAIDANPSERGINYAEGFAQYLKFTKPLGTGCADHAFTDTQAFFYFMVGDASSNEEKQEFVRLIDADVATSRDLVRPMARFDTPIISLEGILWLRNFERANPPLDARTVPIAERMERIAWQSFNEPFASGIEYRVFEHKYKQAHGTGAAFIPVPNFVDLDYDYKEALAELLQKEASAVETEAQGKCKSLSLENKGALLKMAAICSVQTEESRQVEFGRKIAQEFKRIANKNAIKTIEGDTRTDEQKLLVFTRDSWDNPTRRQLIDATFQMSLVLSTAGLYDQNPNA